MSFTGCITRMHDYCVVDLSSFYYDMLKDRLYTKAPASKSRRSAQTAVLEITSALVRLAAPILTFTAEEIWKYLPKTAHDPDSVHVALFFHDADLRTGLPADKIANWELLGKVRAEVLKALEAARNEKRINSGLEAQGAVERRPRAYVQAEAVSGAIARAVYRFAGGVL